MCVCCVEDVPVPVCRGLEPDAAQGSGHGGEWADAAPGTLHRQEASAVCMARHATLPSIHNILSSVYFRDVTEYSKIRRILLF